MSIKKEEMSNENKNLIIKKLIETGKKKGILTYKEIQDAGEAHGDDVADEHIPAQDHLNQKDKSQTQHKHCCRG